MHTKAVLALLGALAGTAAPPANILLTANELAALRTRQATLEPILARCTRVRDYVATPVRIMGPEPHYTATGVNHNGNEGKQLATDAQAAYRAGFCYVVNGDERDAASAQHILDAWARTLTQVTTPKERTRSISMCR